MKKLNNEFSPETLGRILAERFGLRRGQRIWVALSGGIDSQVLLHALAHQRAGSGYDIVALHVDHGLQSDSKQWATLCREWCAQLGVPCVVETVAVASASADGPEAAARRARYRALRQHLGSDDVLLTAHHQDDQAETVLLQLFRGSGVHGLKGMAPASRFGAGRLLRPLLDFSRADLLAYARAHNVRWVDDPSNHDRRYRRNWLRHDILPVLQQHWPRLGAALGRAARHAQEAAELLDDVAQWDLATCRAGDGVETIDLRISAIQRLPLPRRANLLRYWLRRQGFYPPSERHLVELLSWLERAPASAQACLAWPGLELRRYRDELTAMAPLAPVDADWRWQWDLRAPIELVPTGYCLQAQRVSGMGIAVERLGGSTLEVRLRHGGESCQLPGRAFRHKLKKLLQSAGVRPWERERLPLLYLGDQLVAIADRWVCAPYQARAGEAGWCIEWRRARAAGWRDCRDAVVKR